MTDFDTKKWIEAGYARVDAAEAAEAKRGIYGEIHPTPEQYARYFETMPAETIMALLKGSPGRGLVKEDAALAVGRKR